MTPPQSPFDPYRPPSPGEARDVAAQECREVVMGLWDYLDGNCSSELAARIEAHTSSCVPCLRVRRSQERCFKALAELTRRWSAPRSVRDRIRWALEAERRQTRLS